MSTLAAWQSFARSTGLQGWSRMKKDELVIFLLENLWVGEGLNPRRSKARWRKRRQRRKNPLDVENEEINVPILIPERKPFPSRAIPRTIEQNVDTVIDWTDWLESMKDVDIRRKANPAVEKLKQEVADLWNQKLIVEEGKSALKDFAKQFIIHGDDSSSPQEFFQKARGEITKLLMENPQTKVKCILNCEMSRIVGEEEIVDEPFFHSRQKRNLGNNMEIIDEMEKEMIEIGKL